MLAFRSACFRRLVLALTTITLIGILQTLPLLAQGQQVRLEASAAEVAPGDEYQLQWMERSGVTFVDDVTLEESSDASFADAKILARYSTRSHHKKFENNPSASFLVRYYRVRAKASVRTENDIQVEEVVSNPVRVILAGTNKALRPASIPTEASKTTPTVDKDKKSDGDDKQKDEYPTAGRPDLVITRIVISPEQPRPGEMFSLLVQVRNKGVAPSAPTNVQVDVADRTFLLEVDVLKPNAGQNMTVPPVRTPKTGPLVVRATIDPDERLVESRKDNNVKEATFPLAQAKGEAPSNSATPKPAP